MNYVETDRLILRQWRATDHPGFAELNANAEVMQFFPAKLSRAQSDASIARFHKSIINKGWGFWAAELKQSGEFIGFIGINEPVQYLPFSPCIEIGWRLATRFWGMGYASEGASACLKYAFGELRLPEIVSFTPVTNYKSESVMRRIGMVNTGQNFMYPTIPETHPLAEHLLYKASRQNWLATQS